MAQPVHPYPGTLLRRGCANAAVRQVQRRLGVQQTGTYGETTEGCVTAFQRAHGLEADGVVGPLTWAVLFDLSLTTLECARKYVGVRETASNRGPQIDRWNRLTGVPLGSPWCASFAYGCVQEACDLLGITNPLPRTGSSSALYRWAQEEERRVGLPMPGEIGLVRGGPTGHCHTVICAALPYGIRAETIEGNSNSDGSANGTEVVHRVPGRRLDTCDWVRL